MQDEEDLTYPKLRLVGSWVAGMSHTVLKGLCYFRQLSRLAQLKPSLGAGISVADFQRCSVMPLDKICVVLLEKAYFRYLGKMYKLYTLYNLISLVSFGRKRGTCHYFLLCPGVLPALCLMLATLPIVEWYMAALGTHGLTRTAPIWECLNLVP